MDNASYELLIDGELKPAAEGKTFESLNPFTQTVFASVPEGTATDVDAAVGAARRAFDESWWRWRPYERARLLRRLGDLLDREAADMTHIEVSDNGKIIREMRGMNQFVAAWYRHAASLVETSIDGVPTGMNPDIHALTLREPWGVVGIQTPWNTPAVILAQSAAAALAAGNTIVVKPSEHAPCSTLAFGRLVQEAGFPPGVVNIVTGFGGVVGKALCSHPGVDRLSFTGSLEGGRIVAAQAAERPIPVLLELGGKSANIVFEDADLPSAVDGVLAGIVGAAGQSCAAGSRALIHESVYDEVMAGVVTGMSSLTMGDPMDDATDIGPVCTHQQLDKILHYIQLGLDEGASIAVGGGQPTAPDEVSGGWFVEPTAFVGATNQMKVSRDEIFGPVLAAIPFRTEDEAVAIANDSVFGLAAGVWTENLARAHRTVRRLRAGTVWVNQYRKGDPAYPFGGYGASGYGRVNGEPGFQEMTQIKSVQINTAG